MLSERGDNVALAVQPSANWQPLVPNNNPTPSGVAARPSWPPMVPGWQWLRVVYNGIPSRAFPFLLK